MTTRLEKFYKEAVTPKLVERFSYANPMQVPRLTKITLNMDFTAQIQAHLVSHQYESLLKKANLRGR